MNAKSTLTVLAVLLASTAYAGDNTKMGDTTTLPSFTTLDANHDGSVSKTEAQNNSTVSAEFATLDTDKNGSLSSAEYAGATGSTTPDESSKY